MSRELCRVYFISALPPRPASDVLNSRPRTRAYPIYIHEWTNGVWNFISSTIWDEISCKLSLWRNQICMYPPAPPDLSSLLSRFIAFINSVFALLFSRLILSHLNVPTDRRSNEILFLTVHFIQIHSILFIFFVVKYDLLLHHENLGKVNENQLNSLKFFF